MVSPNGEGAQFAGGGETTRGSVEVIRLRPGLFSLIILALGAAFSGCVAVFAGLMAFGMRQDRWVAEVEPGAAVAALAFLALVVSCLWHAFFRGRYKVVLDDAALTVTLHGKGWRASWDQIADIGAHEPHHALWNPKKSGRRRRHHVVIVSVTTPRGVEDHSISVFVGSNLSAEELAFKLRRHRAKALGLAETGPGYTSPFPALPRSYAIWLYVALSVMTTVPIAAVLLAHLARAD